MAVETSAVTAGSRPCRPSPRRAGAACFSRGASGAGGQRRQGPGRHADVHVPAKPSQAPGAALP